MPARKMEVVGVTLCHERLNASIKFDVDQHRHAMSHTWSAGVCAADRRLKRKEEMRVVTCIQRVDGV